MARLVMKFGGTSVGTVERIKNVAHKVKREVDAGHEVAVVVSAMSGDTNRLVDLVSDISVLHDAREYDVVVSSGEQVTVGLLSLALQGLGSDNRITTLGRGGSDTSAVALAAALKADRCDIYTDVDGIYTADPRIATKAAKLDKITYEEMLELASLGAKVLQTRSVEMAMKHRVKLQVL